MRLIHTSDWHLGQLFYEYDRTEEHGLFLEWLLDTLEAERADALLVAGDIFDHANPSAASERQFYRFLIEARRRQPHLNIVLVAGNHDSPGRLEAPAPLLDEFGITVVGQVTRRDDGSVDTKRLCVPLRAVDGKTAGWCLAIPFLRSGDLPAATGATTGSAVDAGDGALAPGGAGGTAVPASGVDGTAILTALSTPGSPTPASAAVAYVTGVARLYHNALAVALESRRQGEPIVAVGHCHLEGCAISGDSERPIVAGGLDALSRTVFGPHLSYVALGHLHRPQPVTGDERIRYCGSPMPLSFSEIDYPHQVVCVDLVGESLGDVRPIPVPRFAALLRVPEAAAPVEEVLAVLAAHDFEAAKHHLPPYLEVRVKLEDPQPGLRARIDDALAGKGVRLARIETSYAREDSQGGDHRAASPDDLARLTPTDVFAQLYRGRYSQDAPDDLLGAFGELLRGAGEEGLP